MANPNVIDCVPFGKYPSLNHDNVFSFQSQHRSFQSEHCVREDEPEYAALSKPLWPQFPDGAYLNANQAARFYRATQGIQGLIHILNRCAQLRGLSKDYDNEPNHSLSEPHESALWAALIEIGTDLNNLAEDLQLRYLENTR